ncbi:hypothetical protein HDE_04388 [Halotydeus destructor]|nr:hypothetical protein HDE_04388 [Halotydeus destructor]
MSSTPESAYGSPSGSPQGPEPPLTLNGAITGGAVSTALDQHVEPPRADSQGEPSNSSILARTPLRQLFDMLVASTIINGPEYLEILDTIKTKSLMTLDELDDVKRGSSTLLDDNLSLTQELEETSDAMDTLKKMNEDLDRAMVELEDAMEQEIFDLKSSLNGKTVLIAELKLQVSGYRAKTIGLQRQVTGQEKDLQGKEKLIESLQGLIDLPWDTSSQGKGSTVSVKDFSFGFVERPDQLVCVPPPEALPNLSGASGGDAAAGNLPGNGDANAHRGDSSAPPPLAYRGAPHGQPANRQAVYDAELERLSSPKHVEKQINLYQPKDSFSAWSRSIEALADLHDWTDQIAILVMVNRLSIEARNMVSTRVDLSVIRDATFEQAREVFLKVFHQDDQGHAGFEKSRLCRQTTDMSGHDYLEKKRAVLSAWKPDANEDVIVSEIVSGLLPEVGIKVQEMAGLTKLSLTTLRDSLLRVETLDSKRKDLEAKSSMESKILAQAKELEQLKIQLRRPKPLPAPKPSNPNWDKQCHHCGKFGHLINECRSNPANQGPVANMAMVQNQGRGRGRGRGYGRGGKTCSETKSVSELQIFHPIRIKYSHIDEITPGS